MLRPSKLVDYAIVILVILSKRGEMTTGAELAVDASISLPTTAKLLKELAAGGLIESRRGACGGYLLSAPLKEISVKDVIKIIDGPINLVSCCRGGACPREQVCPLNGCWDVLNQKMLNLFSEVSLEELTKDACFAFERSAS
ncbi:SUF system Fe-S cluster assembly regulator [Acetobacteraceae bacterium]|nr:SUF system Fe-S cluster assembly regulator [Acetobacteraceae bacterium]